MPRFCTFLLIYCATVAANSQPPAAELTLDQWREDLRFVAETIPTAHKNAYHSVSKETLDAELDALQSRLDALEPYEIALELMRIVALIGDGHSQLRAWDSGLLRQYPIATYLFEDGIYVVDAQPGLEHLVGAKILRIGSGDAEEVWRAVGEYVPHDNEWTVKAWTPTFLGIPELLHTLGYVEDMSAAPWTFETNEGNRIEAMLEPISVDAWFDWLDARETPEDVPLYRRHPEPAYWLKALPEHETVYFRFNRVRNGENSHLAGFSRELIRFIDDNRARFLIVDVRNNGGGNGDLLRPLIQRIARHETVNQPGHLFVITNRNTFSAAMMFVTRTDRATEARFAGEPPGGKPNHYGDVGEHTLPNSKLELRLSPRYHQESDPEDTRTHHGVDIPVPFNAQDYFQDRDPVLQAVFDEIDAQRR